MSRGGKIFWAIYLPAVIALYSYGMYYLFGAIP